MPDGVIVIDKPSGMTSHDVVSAVKRAIGAKRVGHLGTLDPMATGVLPLVIDGATKSAFALQTGKKAYRAVMKLGESTDTFDAEGKVTLTRSVSFVTPADVERVMSGFCGEQMQTPPMYSAVKKNGVPLYKLARAGVTIEREPRAVTIYSCSVVFIEMPFVSFEVECSGGTYVRTLCHDAGEALGTGAHLAGLRRTRSGRFTLADAVPLDAGKEGFLRALMPLASLLEGGGKGEPARCA